MVVTFWEKLSGLFDRRFIVSCWIPVFLTLGTTGATLAVVLGPGLVLKWWTSLDVTSQIWIGGLVLASGTILAYVLQALTTPVVRLYEGYWPFWLNHIAQRAVKRQQKKRAVLTEGVQRYERENNLTLYHAYYHELYYSFPHDRQNVRATQLGNVLTAAEEYPFKLYEINSIVWWPRLVLLLPEPFRQQLDAILTPVLTTVNLSALLNLYAVLGGVIVALATQRWWLYLPVTMTGLLLARICYKAAVNQAMLYGDLIRAAFDLHRHDVLAQMRIPLPANLAEEKQLWKTLNQLIYHFIPPADSNWPPNPIELYRHRSYRFKYSQTDKNSRSRQNQEK